MNDYKQLAQVTNDTTIPKSAGTLNDSILNTPAEEQKDVIKTLPDRAKDTFFQLNKPKSFQPEADVVLDIDGKKTQIKGTEVQDSKLQTVEKMLYGTEGVSEKSISATTILVIAAILVGLFVVIILSQRRSDYVLRLEKEIDNLKKDRISGL